MAACRSACGGEAEINYTYADFLGPPQITDLDIHGTAFDDTFSLENITGMGVIYSNWESVSWLWNQEGATTLGLHNFELYQSP